ncbi:hypothetical protein PIB30_027087 [Stylosanthes scabra]|uniref:RNase H type-1 domain-containing protein n=1 Tax=Stylosanthes scabra TaxID=79078 RepID=A0ABU6UAD6_9FABA|nr:hypothetical protein [Stylosanthes scabra]
MGWFWQHSSSKAYTCKDGYLWLAKKYVNWNEDCNWLWLWRLQETIQDWILHNCKYKEALFCSSVWWIWRDRNNDVFNNLEPWSISKVKGLCLSLTKDLQNAAHFQHCITHQSLLSHWIPPLEFQLKAVGANSMDLISKIDDILSRNWTVHFQLIQRTANRVADFMAKEAAVQRLPHTEWLQPRNSFLPCLAKDLLQPS